MRTPNLLVRSEYLRRPANPARQTGHCSGRDQNAMVRVYNRSMRILLLNLYYTPDTSATAKMAETVVNALARENEVTILCGRPSYDPAERRAWQLFRTEETKNVRIVRVGSTDFPRFNMKKRVLNYLTYTALVIPRALFTPCD